MTLIPVSNFVRRAARNLLADAMAVLVFSSLMILLYLSGSN